MKKALMTALKWLKGAFTKNLGMKIGSLVIAFLLWSFVVAEQNPVREKTFVDIPVTFIGQEELRYKNLTVTEPYQELLSSCQVTVEANADRISLINEGMISVEVDLADIASVGKKTLPVKARSTMTGTTIETSPKEITLMVEEIVSRQVPVEVELIGEKKDWLYYGEPILSENAITVTGARSNVEEVTKAVCEISIDNIEEYIKETHTVILLNAEGERLADNLFTGVPSVIVELPIFPQKTVSIDLQNIESTTTGIAEGYEIVGVEADPAAVNIVGKLEEINTIDSVKVEPIVLDGASADQVVTAKLQIPEGLYTITPSEVQIKLVIAPQQDKIIYPSIDIGIKNLREGYAATVSPSSIDIEVNGPKTILDEMTAADLKPIVDLADLGTGQYTIELKFENAPDLGVNIVPSMSAVNVVIREE